MFANPKNCLIFASTLLCLFVWVFRALLSDKGSRVFFCPFLRRRELAPDTKGATGLAMRRGERRTAAKTRAERARPNEVSPVA